MLRKYITGLLSAAGACLLFATDANALLITGGVGSSSTGVAVTGIGDQCIEIGGVASTSPGVAVNSWECDAGLNQMWIITNGEIQRASNGSFVCLTAGGNTAGSPITLAYCRSLATQLWTVNATGAIVNAASGLCLDWGEGYYQNNVQLTVQACDGLPQQQFWLR
jgi:alpha-galactosidase